MLSLDSGSTGGAPVSWAGSFADAAISMLDAGFVDNELHELALTWACEDEDTVNQRMLALAACKEEADMQQSSAAADLQQAPLIPVRTVTTSGSAEAASTSTSSVPQAQALCVLPQHTQAKCLPPPSQPVPAPQLTQQQGGQDSLPACSTAGIKRKAAGRRKPSTVLALIDTRTANGRRKCTTERNKSRVDVLMAQVESLLLQERALSAEHAMLALRARVLQGIVVISDEATQLQTRAQRLALVRRAESPQQQLWPQQSQPWPQLVFTGAGGSASWPGAQLALQCGSDSSDCSRSSSSGGSSSHAASRAQAVSDDTLLYASTLTPASLHRAMRNISPMMTSLLTAYECAPRDAVSNILESRAQAAAACDTPPPGVTGTWPQFVQERHLLALRAAAHEAGVEGALPPRAAALEKLLEFMMDQICPVMHAASALQPGLVWSIMHLHVETGEPLETLPGDEVYAALAAQMGLNDDQRAQVAMLVTQLETMLSRLQAERTSIAASMANGSTSSTISDAGGLTAAVTGAGVSGLALTERLDRLLAREASIMSMGKAYLGGRVLTVPQAIGTHLNSWPYHANPLLLARAIRDAMAVQAPGVYKSLCAAGAAAEPWPLPGSS